MQKDTAGSTRVERTAELTCTSEHARDVDEFFKAVRGKWKVPILGALVGGTRRFGELQRRVPGITQKVLTAQLRQLERDGLVRRRAYAEVPPRVEYALTPKGMSLLPILKSTWVWGRVHRTRHST